MSDRRAEAGQVLDDNWLGSSTKPAPALYPHQWSWDSAFIAIGNRYRRWDRAAAELRSLFAAQWTNGMVPHVAYDPAVGDAGYFPTPGFWQTDRVAEAPEGRPTSGICQPPVHASALLAVHQAAPDKDAGRHLAADLFEPMVAWHDHLHRDRAIDGSLVECWHPWETGMDNAPAWDEPLADMRYEPSDVPAYERADTGHVDAAERPTADHYDSYAYLVARLRREQYQPSNPRDLPFRVHDVLFNSALARAELDLAHLAEAIGAGTEGDRRRQLAAEVRVAIDREMWCEHAGLYLNVDARTGARLPARGAGGLTPVIAGTMQPDRLQRLLTTMTESFLVPLSPTADAMRTVPLDEHGFEPARYWRGPSWINLAWLVANGLAGNGAEEPADRLRRGIAHLVEEAGFHEYFDPDRRAGHGTDRFSWTAALYLDVTHPP